MQNNTIKNFIKAEFSGWSKFEAILIPFILTTVIILSINANDHKIATLHAFFGILATILAGKGKISCYPIGIIGVFCYSYLAFKNALWGSLLLHILYYIPMNIIGIFAWKNHLKEDTKEVKKTKLTPKERILFTLLATIISIILGIILIYLNDKYPFPDAFVTILPILAFILTIKRCFEQWIVWTIVNGINIIMWLFIFINGGNTFATLLTWLIYFCFGIYFLYKWKKELSNEIVEAKK